MKELARVDPLRVYAAGHRATTCFQGPRRSGQGRGSDRVSVPGTRRLPGEAQRGRAPERSRYALPPCSTPRGARDATEMRLRRNQGESSRDPESGAELPPRSSPVSRKGQGFAPQVPGVAESRSATALEMLLHAQNALFSSSSA